MCKKRCDQGIGVPRHRDGDTAVHHPVEVQEDRQRLTGTQRRHPRGEVAGEHFAEDREFFGHLTGGESPGGGGPAIVLAGPLPELPPLAAQWPRHLGHQVHHQAELATHQFDGNGRRPRRPIPQTARPLRHQLLAPVEEQA